VLNGQELWLKSEALVVARGQKDNTCKQMGFQKEFEEVQTVEGTHG